MSNLMVQLNDEIERGIMSPRLRNLLARCRAELSGRAGNPKESLDMLSQILADEGVDLNWLYTKSRSTSRVRVRDRIAWRLRHESNPTLSFLDISNLMRISHHSTVILMVRRHEERRKHD